MSQKETLPVIFRKFKKGDVIAFFPNVADTYDVNECLSYMHIGQHGTASTDLISSLKKCEYKEYENLLNEIKGIYSNCIIKVVTKSSNKYYYERKAMIKEYLNN